MLLSVIIPAYNCATTIKKCINSITTQNYKDIEIILINDGSTDNTDECCRILADTDKRIKYYTTGNIGVSSTRNMGISLATGDYITFVDSDDFIESDMYSKMMDSIISNKSDVCVCGYNLVSDTQSKEVLLPFQSEILQGYKIKSEYVPLLIGDSDSKSLLGSCCCCIYSAKLLNTSKFPEDIKLQEDSLFNLECFMQTHKVSFINKGLYNYYINFTSATNRYRVDAIEQIFLLEKNFTHYAHLLEELGIDCTVNLNNTIVKWILFLLKNISTSKCPLSIKEKKAYLKKIFSNKSFSNCIYTYKPKSKKQAALFLLLKLKQYYLLSLFLKG